MEISSNEVEPEMPAVLPGKKRKFPLEIRRQIVQYYDTLPNDGSKGAYLRRNGLFDSQISDWRNEPADEPGATKTAGRKSLTSTEKELRLLKARNDKLQAELDRANVVIDIQKKVSQLLEMHLEPKGQAS